MKCFGCICSYWSFIFQLGILHVVCAGEAHSVLVVYCQCFGFCGKTVPPWPHSLNSARVTHIMPIFPPIMLCSYAQLRSSNSHQKSTHETILISSLSDMKSMVACKVEVNTVILG